jgi:POT family proton-dependent oligopeptide transporter
LQATSASRSCDTCGSEPVAPAVGGQHFAIPSAPVCVKVRAMSKDPDRAFFGHPAGLRTLFFTEMWERLSYYGARTFLGFYMFTPASQGGRGMSIPAAGMVLALYLSSVYLLSLPGGWIADRFLGQRKAVTIGGIGIMLGNAMLALPVDDLFYPGLVLIAVGTGFLKPNLSTIVGQLYKPDDIRRDAGFTVYYMGINIGAGAAPLVGTLIAQSHGFRSMLEDQGIDPNMCWRIAFAVPAIGMALGIVQYLLGYKKLGDAGLRPTVPSEPAKAARDRMVLGVIVGGLAALVALVVVLAKTVGLDKDTLGNAFGIALLIASVVLFIGYYKTARDVGERKRVSAMIPLFVGGIAFFAVFEQASTTMSVFAEGLIHREYLGMHIVASAYQFVNAGCIIVMASGFAWMWLRLARAGKEPSSVNKFAIGTVITALSVIVLLPTVSTIGQIDGINSDYWFVFPFRTVSPTYLVVFYVFATCAELCISPVGLSSMSKLAPPRLAGMVMGTWFLATAVGNYLAGRSAQLSSSRGWGFLFNTLIIASVVIAVALFAVAPLIKRMLAGSDHTKASIGETKAEDVVAAVEEARS